MKRVYEKLLLSYLQEFPCRVLQVGFHPIQRFSLSETICPAPIDFRSDGFVSKDR
jgi:hypothetical protein